MLLRLTALSKAYAVPDGTTRQVVAVPEFTLAAGEHRALRGASGSGKTTFLNLIAGILAADGGEIVLDGTKVTKLGEAGRDRLRAAKLGYIFQTFNLLQGHTVLENVELGMAFGAGVDRARAESLLQRVGLGDRLHYYPRQLSTGQQQRVAVARALANRPKLVLADEPTGNLDGTTGKQVMDLLFELARAQGTTLILITHDMVLAGRCDRIVRVADGLVVSDERTPSALAAQ